VTGWSDPVEEKTGFVEATCQNYEVLMEEKRAGRGGGVGPSQCHESLIGEKQKDVGTPGGPEKARKASFRMTTEIGRSTDVRRVFEERILDSCVELTLREVLGIAKKEVRLQWTAGSVGTDSGWFARIQLGFGSMGRFPLTYIFGFCRWLFKSTLFGSGIVGRTTHVYF
jgi:hypothetical protein